MSMPVVGPWKRVRNFGGYSECWARYQIDPPGKVAIQVGSDTLEETEEVKEWIVAQLRKSGYIVTDVQQTPRSSDVSHLSRECACGIYRQDCTYHKS